MTTGVNTVAVVAESDDKPATGSARSAARCCATAGASVRSGVRGSRPRSCAVETAVARSLTPRSA